jgi:hypothetical protein
MLAPVRFFNPIADVLPEPDIDAIHDVRVVKFTLIFFCAAQQGIPDFIVQQQWKSHADVIMRRIGSLNDHEASALIMDMVRLLYENALWPANVFPIAKVANSMYCYQITI